MKRNVVLIDGFNLYHALDYSQVKSNPMVSPHRYKKYKWLDLYKLSSSYIYSKNDTLNGVYYFTTLATWDPSKVAKHKDYIRAQEENGVIVIYGEFKNKARYCSLCKRYSPSREEKQTDVNIALMLVRLAVEDKFDRAIIISGDTDLIPAVKMVKDLYPQKEIGVVIPIGKISEGFKKEADFHHKMKESHLQGALLPDPMHLVDGTVLNCPPKWK